MEFAADLIAGKAIGYEFAAQLLITVREQSRKIKEPEANFAALCGVNPIPASSGMIYKHRLNRDGDSAANRALHIIAIGRLRIDVKTTENVKNIVIGAYKT